MNLLMNVFQNFADNFVRRMHMPAIVVAVIFVSVGLGLVIVARKIAEVCRRTKDIADTDAIMVSFKVVGMVLIFVALMIVVFRGINF